jgi:hypothetical protein
MKSIILILLILCPFFGISQTAASIIGKPVRIGNILFAQHDLPNVMKLEEAKNACSTLGKRCRLTTKE